MWKIEFVYFLKGDAKKKNHLQDVVVSRELPTANVDVAEIGPVCEDEEIEMSKRGGTCPRSPQPTSSLPWAK